MFVGIGDVEFVFGIEVVVDPDVELIAIDVVFQSLLSADQAVAVANPAIDGKFKPSPPSLKSLGKGIPEITRWT